MLCGEGRVKWLDAERLGVLRKALGAHQRERPESANVAIMNRASVGQRQLDRRVFSLAVGKIAGIDEQRTGEARLHDDPITGRKIEHDELGASPPASDLGAR